MISRTQRQFFLLKRKYKTAKAIAKLAKVSEGTISRIISGEAKATWKTVRNLLKTLDAHDGDQLLAGYLTDLIPRRRQRTIRVQIDQHPTMDNILSQLSAEGYEAVERIARLCAEKEEMCQMFSLQGKLWYEMLHRPPYIPEESEDSKKQSNS